MIDEYIVQFCEGFFIAHIWRTKNLFIFLHTTIIPKSNINVFCSLKIFFISMVFDISYLYHSFDIILLEILSQLKWLKRHCQYLL